jgi:hypothetical protein
MGPVDCKLLIRMLMIIALRRGETARPERMLNYPISRKPVSLARVACLENVELETDVQPTANTAPVSSEDDEDDQHVTVR